MTLDICQSDLTLKASVVMTKATNSLAEGAVLIAQITNPKCIIVANATDVCTRWITTACGRKIVLEQPHGNTILCSL
jgi:hypothetical protein